jgi:hypothetical protein
MTVRSQKPD